MRRTALRRRGPGDRRPRPCRDPARLIEQVLESRRRDRRGRRDRRHRRAGADRRGDGRPARRQGLALAAGKPLIAVNHLEGHALSPRWSIRTSTFPICCCSSRAAIASCSKSRGRRYRRLATTIDDAAGEAFDKAAKLLGLGYPGGPAIERWPPTAIRRRCRCRARWSGPSRISPSPASRARCSAPSRAAITPEDIAASFQQAVVDCLVDRTAARSKERCAEPGRRRRSRGQPAVRSALTELGEARAGALRVPPAWLCTDNAAMIAWAGAERFAAG
jgi:N6-L-threonylcarbamoyladenine synthase